MHILLFYSFKKKEKGIGYQMKLTNENYRKGEIALWLLCTFIYAVRPQRAR